jgi:hypothetical protein
MENYNDHDAILFDFEEEGNEADKTAQPSRLECHTKELEYIPRKNRRKEIRSQISKPTELQSELTKLCDKYLPARQHRARRT